MIDRILARLRRRPRTGPTLAELYALRRREKNGLDPHAFMYPPGWVALPAAGPAVSAAAAVPSGPTPPIRGIAP